MSNKEWNAFKRDISVAAAEVEKHLEQVCQRHDIRVFAQLHFSRVDENGKLVQMFSEVEKCSVQIDIDAGF